MSECLFLVKCETREQSEILQLTAFANGYDWNGSNGKSIKHVDQPYLFIYNDKHICFGGFVSEDHQRDGTPQLAYLEAIRFFHGKHTLPPAGVKLRIGQHDVIVKPGVSIKFGCTTLNKEEVAKVLNAWNKDLPF